MGRLLIHGTAGQGKVVLDCAESQYDKITFLTNDLNTEKINDYSILFEQETSLEYIMENFDEIIVAVGDNKARLKLTEKYISAGIKLATIIHPNASVSKFAEIEGGTVICANAVIGPFAVLGKANVVSIGGIVAHDCKFEDGVRVSPNAVVAGTCIIGKNTWVCIGANISDHIKIGKNSVIGAGSVVLNDIPDNVLMAGVPAIIKKHME
ncbi:MAG: acetyltransferase [Treponema sp.]|jgi:sugar O-acyltransferase (sialic acid O-acetyltransferase NeuD family)|nr:acetyltransferase [Treponema sp.]